MMDGSDGLRELYQEVILDHNRSPRNFKDLADASHRALGHNPLCGDAISVTLRIEDGRVADAAFQGQGCAIAKSSASLMTETVKGMTVDEAKRAFETFHAMVKGRGEPDFPPGKLAKLAVFTGVREFPARVKCASLAWHTLHAALSDKGDGATVTTE